MPAIAAHVTTAQLRSNGGAGRTGRHLLGAAKGRKMPNFFLNSRENSDCKFRTRYKHTTSHRPIPATNILLCTAKC